MDKQANIAMDSQKAFATFKVMASATLQDDTVVVRLGFLEKLGALHGGLRVPLSAIREVSVADTFVPIRGLRLPGTGVPGVIALGTRRYRGERDFTALYKGREALVMELEGYKYKRVAISIADPEMKREQIKRAMSPEK